MPLNILNSVINRINKITRIFWVSLILFCSTDVLADSSTIFVPFTWQLQTIGKTFASAFVDNTGGIGNSESNSDTLAGLFKISYLLNPPAGYTQVTPLPTQTTLSVVANWTGSLSDSTLTINPFGQTLSTYVKSTATVSAPPGLVFTPTTEEIGGASTKTIDNPASFAFLAGSGSIPFSGSVNISTLFGFGSGTLGDFATGQASLSIKGSLIGPQTTSI